MGVNFLRTRQCGPDHFQHPIDVLKNLVVPETKNPEAFAFEPLGSIGIPFSLLGMLATIKLDNQSGRETNEIDDVAADGGLAPKLMAIHLLVANPLPETLRGFRHVRA